MKLPDDRRIVRVGGRWFVSAAVAVVVVSVLTGSWGHDDFWSVAVPGTLTGVGTLALAAASYAVLTDTRNEQLQRGDRERRDQASKLHVGALEFDERDPNFPADYPVGTVWYGYALEIVNGSDHPISNLSAHLRMDEEMKAAIVGGQHGDDVQTWDRLLPQARVFLEFGVRWGDISIDFNNPATVDVAFVDTQRTTMGSRLNYELRDITGSDEYSVEWYRLARNERRKAMPDEDMI